MTVKAVEALVERIEAKVHAGGAEKLSPMEGTMFLAFHWTAIISNGGFARFYQEGGDIDLLEEVYRALELDACADACARSKRVFPKDHRFSNKRKNAAFVNSHWDSIHGRFTKIADPIFDLGLGFEGLIRAADRYLKRQKKRGR